MDKVRIAVRQAATELGMKDMEAVTGGLKAVGTIMNTPYQCRQDVSTDCWIEGGTWVANDDAS
ncbi:MAG TPA: hypothetical protein VFG18_06235 [Xanthomonadaceae bacterium]|jgi:hypothetical protein|nr:hypothetical protein [Xanthomonadaceae bacterium]